MDLTQHNLSAEENEIFNEVVEQAKASFGEGATDESTMIRFLKAANFDSGRALIAIKENIDWREEEEINTLTEKYDPPAVLKTHFPMYIIGLDREGSPVLVFELGNLYCNGLMKCVTIPAIQKHITYIIEVGENYMKQHPESLAKQKWVVIIDCKDFSALYGTNRTIRNFLQTLIHLYSKHYPERLKHIWAINATNPLNQLLRFLSPMVPEMTAMKMVIFGTTEWKEQIQGLIDPEILPDYLSGTVKSDAKLSPMTPINHGGQIPKKFFTISEGSLKDQSGVTDYTLSRSEILKVPVEVKRSNSVLRWEFETENHSISFGLDYADDASTPPTTLIPQQRIYVDNFTETGEFMCENAGIYTLVFSNHFSWITSKKLYYKFFVSRG